MYNFSDYYNKAIAYSRSRLPVSQIHPAFRYTHLGSHLSEAATHSGDVGSLAKTVLTNAGASGEDKLNQSLELTPLHVLRDAVMENPDHSLAKTFNWDKLPEKVALDQTLRDAIHRYNDNDRQVDFNGRQVQLAPIDAVDVRAGLTRGLPYVNTILNHAREQHPELSSVNDVDDSLKRLSWQLYRGQVVPGQVTDGTEDEANIIHNNMATSPLLTPEFERF